MVYLINIIFILLILPRDISPNEKALSPQFLRVAFRIEYLPKEKSLQSFFEILTIKFLIFNSEKSASKASLKELFIWILFMSPLEYKKFTVSSQKRLSKYNLLDFHSLQAHDADWNKMIEIENKSRINFEFELKGLTGSNKRLNSFFSNVFSNLWENKVS